MFKFTQTCYGGQLFLRIILSLKEKQKAFRQEIFHLFQIVTKEIVFKIFTGNSEKCFAVDWSGTFDFDFERGWKRLRES